MEVAVEDGRPVVGLAYPCRGPPGEPPVVIAEAEVEAGIAVVAPGPDGAVIPDCEAVAVAGGDRCPVAGVADLGRGCVGAAVYGVPTELAVVVQAPSPEGTVLLDGQRVVGTASRRRPFTLPQSGACGRHWARHRRDGGLLRTSGQQKHDDEKHKRAGTHREHSPLSLWPCRVARVSPSGLPDVSLIAGPSGAGSLARVVRQRVADNGCAVRGAMGRVRISRAGSPAASSDPRVRSGLPTECRRDPVVAAGHRRAPRNTGGAVDPGLCSAIASDRLRPVTPSACCPNLVSVVRFSRGYHKVPAQVDDRWSPCAHHFRIGEATDIPPTRPPTRPDTRPRGITAAARRRGGRIFGRPRMPLVRTWW